MSLATLMLQAPSRPRAEPRLAVVERVAPAGSMPPLHIRREEERYEVLEGAVSFFVGGEVVLAETGDVVVAPAGAPRTFRVESQRARWLVRTRVASMQRFEEFGWAVAPAAGGGWTSLEEASTIAAIGAPNGIELLGPPGLLPASA